MLMTPPPSVTHVTHDDAVIGLTYSTGVNLLKPDYTSFGGPVEDSLRSHSSFKYFGLTHAAVSMRLDMRINLHTLRQTP